MSDASPAAADIDRLCQALAALALDWSRRHVDGESDSGLQTAIPSGRRVEQSEVADDPLRDVDQAGVRPGDAPPKGLSW